MLHSKKIIQPIPTTYEALPYGKRKRRIFGTHFEPLFWSILEHFLGSFLRSFSEQFSMAKKIFWTPQNGFQKSPKKMTKKRLKMVKKKNTKKILKTFKILSLKHIERCQQYKKLTQGETVQ